MRSVLCLIRLLMLELWTTALVLIIYIRLNLGFKGFEALSVCDVVNGYASVGISEVGLGNATESLLACSVPYLHFDESLIDFEGFYLEIYSHSAW